MNAQTVERQETFEPAPPAPRGNIVPLAPQAAPKAYPPKIAQALLAITREFGAITKSGYNKFHEYYYQKWEDVLQRESELLAKHGIIVQQSEVARSLLDKLVSISYEFTIINEDGDFWPDRPVWTAIARLQDNKGVFDDKAANKAHTQAHKYFLLHLFKIRTKETVEDDADNGAPTPPKPGTPEAKVYVIPADGHNQHTWSAAFIEAIGKAQAAEVDQYIASNRNSLSKIETYPEVDAKVKAAIAARRAPVPPKPNGPPKPAPRAPAPAKPAERPMPNPTDDITAFCTWLDGKLTAITDYAAAETLWNDKVAPVVDNLFPPDQEQLMGLWRKHERRLEP